MALEDEVWGARSHLDFILDGALRDNVPQVDFPTVGLGGNKAPILLPDAQTVNLKTEASKHTNLKQAGRFRPHMIRYNPFHTDNLPLLGAR